MVSDKGDIPERDEVKPSNQNKGILLDELLDRGETIVHLRDGSSYELHGYDTHIYDIHHDDQRPRRHGIVYTQNEDEEEIWFSIDEIVSFVQH